MKSKPSLKLNFISDTAWVLFFIILFILLKNLLFSVYLVPSVSMRPNIEPGDRIFTNKLAYGFWLPFMKRSIFSFISPQRGDIILFNAPNNDGIYIKRVIGIAGDLISFDKGIITINNNIVRNINGIPISNNSDSSNIYTEFSLNLPLPKHKIMISVLPDRSYFEDRRFLVPANYLFVLGDNRDDSQDSRSFGYINESEVIGKANFILFSTIESNHILPVFKTDRIFKKLK